MGVRDGDRRSATVLKRRKLLLQLDRRVDYLFGGK